MTVQSDSQGSGKDVAKVGRELSRADLLRRAAITGAAVA